MPSRAMAVRNHDLAAALHDQKVAVHVMNVAGVNAMDITNLCARQFTRVWILQINVLM